jgi:hypothetical protein
MYVAITFLENAQNVKAVPEPRYAFMIVFAQSWVASTWSAPRLWPISCVGTKYLPGAQPT